MRYEITHTFLCVYMQSQWDACKHIAYMHAGMTCCSCMQCSRMTFCTCMPCTSEQRVAVHGRSVSSKVEKLNTGKRQCNLMQSIGEGEVV